MKVQEKKDLDLLEAKIPEFPDYVIAFFRYKMPSLSPSSLIEYARDFDMFFCWLLSQKSSDTELVKDVSLDMLNQLSVQDFNGYINYLVRERMLTAASVARKINSVRSMFNYLYEIAEDINEMPLLKRNVMKRIVVKRPETPIDVAQKMEGKILNESEMTEFVRYLKEQYYTDMFDNPQAIYSFEMNKDRDISMINLFLNSGLRVGDVVNMNLDDLVLLKNFLFVGRKTQGRIPVTFDDQVKADLIAYLDIKKDRYSPCEAEKAVFLTVPNGKTEGQRMTKRAIQEMVIKYAKKFGKDNLTVSRLRDSFGVKHVAESDIVHTKHQMVLGTIEAAEKYLYINNRLHE